MGGGGHQPVLRRLSALVGEPVEGRPGLRRPDPGGGEDRDEVLPADQAVVIPVGEVEAGLVERPDQRVEGAAHLAQGPDSPARA
ncbi:hypothetical protein [Streptomyces sp. NPDC048516]|uniref:hypothetical protein n=1 Tax=Streptomyces sp. NPDC048516 TaxID=3365565 RepID=UPI003715DDD1